MSRTLATGTPQTAGTSHGPAAARPDRERDAERGYIHVYTGDGKGKTTAAMGLALRAVGHDRRVFIGQFMKSGAVGEVAALRAFPAVCVEQFGRGGRVALGRIEEAHVQQARDGLNRSRAALQSGDYDVVILDEIDIAICCGLLTADDCLALLDARPSHVDLVLTGRSAPKAIVERADLVTEMREVKHYYRRGAAARAGIEY